MVLFGLALAISPSATLTIQPDKVLAVAPRDVNGFSYEAMQLTDPNYFSPENTELVELCKRLSKHGVLRIGGNSSELAWWQPTPSTPTPPEILAQAKRAGPWTNRQPYAITPKAIDNLAKFLKKTGWTIIYGLNFGAGTPARDAAEAAFVSKKFGKSLKYFQIGNEPDLYTTSDNGGRPKGWNFENYKSEWLAIAHTVIEKVRDAKFGGPDVANYSDWVIRFGKEVGPLMKGRLVALSGHYYAMGPAGSKTSTIENVLKPAIRNAKGLDEIRPTCESLGAHYRMTEGNTCYRGGQAGVSNALASALWGADYILEVLAHGGEGVNFHGGIGSHISIALGGHLPGARNEADIEIAKTGTFYSPIAGTPQFGYQARPLYYGMALAEKFAGTAFIQTTLAGTDANVTAYAARENSGKYLIAIINKDLSKDLTITISGLPKASGYLSRLTGPSLDATQGITFAPEGTKKTSIHSINVPHGSAVLIRA